MSNAEELHPHLPSGEWEGFYCYDYSAEQHKMQVELNFSASEVSGAGADDVAAFTWDGTYDLDAFKINMMKRYATHGVWYKGDIDENGIWGIWEINLDYLNLPASLVDSVKEVFKDQLKGGFHIWPKKRQRARIRMALKEKTESKKLLKIFTEVFA